MSNIVSLESRRPQPGGNRKGTRRRFGNVRKLPSGRHQASYLAPDGRRVNAPTTFDRKGDALAWLDMQSAAITEGRWKPAQPAKTATVFGDYATAWLERRELKPRTRSEYKRLLDQKIRPTFDPLPLDHITPKRVRDWYATLDPTKKTARAHAYALLRTILGAAQDEELLTVNPCRIHGAASTKRSKQIRPATLDELTALTEAMPERYRLMIVLASWCALRFGELAELRRHDIDLKAKVIRVRRGVTWPDGKPAVGTPKSGAGVRDVTIPPHLAPVIRSHLKTHAQPGADGLVFPNTEGAHLHHGSLYKVFKPARLKAGRPDLRFHDLRHSGAVFAAEAGATIAELMERLGHATPAMAMRYQHVAGGRSAEIARRLSAIATGDQ